MVSGMAKFVTRREAVTAPRSNCTLLRGTWSVQKTPFGEIPGLKS
jgi:hypothetical protein